ncbi:MAG TPA: DUF1800 domain-containing protein [Candidatus Xenobia bacterium]|jgi:uncharacterized protein (DUF1800 family)
MTPELCHLWRAAAFGPRPAASYEAAVQSLLAWPDDRPVTSPPFSTLLPPGITLGIIEIGRLIQWWVDEMVATPWPLREKMVLFWHGHFTTSADPVFSAGLLLHQNQLFRSLALGRFEDLLTAVTLNPAMLVYLDGKENRRAHPNENYARELMELFTVGIGHYTEKDVKEAARALTGWKLGGLDGHAVFDPAAYDDGDKQFMTLRGRLGMSDVIHHLATHPATAERLCSRLYRFCSGLDPSPAERGRLTQVFQATRGHVGAVVRQLLLGDEFRRARGGWRSPIECVVHAAQVLDRPLSRLTWIGDMQRMGQVPFLPPSVKGWDDGAAWINTSTLLERVNWASRLAQHPPAGFVDLLDSPEGVPELLLRLGLADASASTRQTLETLAQQTPDRCQRATRVLTAALASPDFQLK